MVFFQQFGLLFANMEWFVIVCLCVGLAALLIEIFDPGMGIFGIIGGILLIMAIILRAIFHQPEDNVLMQSFQLILLLFLFIALAFTLFIVGHKKKWWKNSFLMHEDTVVDVNHSEGTADFSNLIGETGIASTDLRPVGKMLYCDRTYDVVAENFYIEKGINIKVTAVEGSKITVKIAE